MAKGIKVKVSFRRQAVKKAMEKGTIRSLFKAAGFVAKVAKNSIEVRKQIKKEKSDISEDQRQAFVDKIRQGDRDFLRSLNKLKTRRQASKPGEPPLTSQQRQLKRAILFDVEKDKLDAVVGPTFPKLATIGKIHEFGGTFNGRRYPKRAFMRPALLKASPRLSRFWANSIRS